MDHAVIMHQGGRELAVQNAGTARGGCGGWISRVLLIES